MPVSNARDQQTEPNPVGASGERREGRHSLEAVARTASIHGPEVVEAPGAVEAELLTEPDSIDDLTEFEPLLGDVDTQSHVRERLLELGDRFDGGASHYRLWCAPRSSLKLAPNPHPRAIAALTSRLGADSAPRFTATYDQHDRNHSDNDGWLAESGCGHSRFRRASER
jgi:hypothetical protein